MSIADFGSSVDEVQQKLSDILPLVDAGESLAEELHGRIASEAGGWTTTIESIAESSKEDDAMLTKFEKEVTALENVITESWKTEAGEFDKLAAKTTKTLTSVESRFSLIEEQLKSRATTLSSSVETLDENCDTVREKAQSLINNLRDTRETYNNSRDETRQEIIKSHEKVYDAYTKVEAEISLFHERDTDYFKRKITESIDSFKEAIPEFNTKTEEAIEAAQTEAKKVFDDLEGDVNILAAEVLTNYKESLSGLQEGIESEAKSLEQELTQYADSTVDILQQELKETLAVAYTANQYLGGMSPLLAGIAATKRLAESINDAM
jgi:hypothetical protein